SERKLRRGGQAFYRTPTSERLRSSWRFWSARKKPFLIQTRSVSHLARCFPRSFFTLITRTAPVLAPATLSCVAVYPRDSRSRRVLCLARRSVGEGRLLIPFARFFLLPFGFLIHTSVHTCAPVETSFPSPAKVSGWPRFLRERSRRY